MSPEKQKIVHQLVDRLSQVKSIKAIVLGGSYARGTATRHSDIDLGLYYSEKEPLDRRFVQRVVNGFTKDNVTVTALYEWGAWVNGGGWMETEQGKVDLLYRSLEQVKRVIQKAHSGKIEHDFAQQPPYGFYSVTYLGETQTAQILYDPKKVIQALKKQVSIYPEKLRQAIIQEQLWSAVFSLFQAKKYAAVTDQYSLVGCITRIVANCTQVLYALNETYFISDKEAMNAITHFAKKPKAYTKRLLEILARPCEKNALIKLEKLVAEIKALVGDLYIPKYKLQQSAKI